MREGPATEIVSRHTVIVEDGDKISIDVKSVVSHDLTNEQCDKLLTALQECIGHHIIEIMK